MSPRDAAGGWNVRSPPAELEASRPPERAGRAMDHESEDAFERLRAEGCM